MASRVTFFFVKWREGGLIGWSKEDERVLFGDGLEYKRSLRFGSILPILRILSRNHLFATFVHSHYYYNPPFLPRSSPHPLLRIFIYNTPRTLLFARSFSSFSFRSSSSSSSFLTPRQSIYSRLVTRSARSTGSRRRVESGFDSDFVFLAHVMPIAPCRDLVRHTAVKGWPRTSASRRRIRAT